jgi:hypothetical protein
MRAAWLRLAGTAALLWGAAPAGAAPVTVAVANRTAITASSVPAAVGAQNGNFDSASGRVGIRSGLVGSLSTLAFNAVSDRATGEIGLRWGVEADHCLGSGGCGKGDAFVDATAELVLIITVAPRVATWKIQIGVQSYGNVNGVVDGGTLPACTSVISVPTFEVTATNGAVATLSFLSGSHFSVFDAGDCVQGSDWFKDENAGITVSGRGSGSFEVHISQDASVRSQRQTSPFAIKNGSDSCFRAGMDPGEGIAFFDACNYPGLAAANGNRNGNLILGNEPDDGGIWLTDRVTGVAIELTGLSFEAPGAP